MMNIIHTLFGEGKDLTILNMACRAFLMFFIALLFIRISGMRSFAKKSAFDEIIVIMLGAVLSRPIVGASAFFPTVLAALILVFIHKSLARVVMNNKRIATLIKGECKCLFQNGKFNWKNMKKCCLSQEDIMEEIRIAIHQNGVDEVKEIFMETGGKISIVKKQE